MHEGTLVFLEGASGFPTGTRGRPSGSGLRPPLEGLHLYALPPPITSVGKEFGTREPFFSSHLPQEKTGGLWREGISPQVRQWAGVGQGQSLGLSTPGLVPLCPVCTPLGHSQPGPLPKGGRGSVAELGGS